MQCTLMKARNERRTMPTTATVFTIGYQSHSLESLVECLKLHGVEILMDVRQNPFSWKAGFSKRRLQDAVSKAGIEYVHNPDLGTPPRIRNMYRGTGDVSEALAEYERHLTSDTKPIRSLARIAESNRVCLLCLESDHRMCHRGVIAQKLCEMTKWQPIHLA